MNISFLDWSSHHEQFKAAWLRDAEMIYRSGVFLNGPYVARFENEFAQFCNPQSSTISAIGVANGLDALTLSLRSLNLKPQSEVLVPGNTFIATALAVLHAGLKPVLVPPCTGTYNIDVDKLDEYVTSHTRVIIAVHLYGRMCEMEKLLKWAGEKNITLIEDAAQAHGALYDGKRAGSFGDMACFSFYPGKNLGALGDAGAVVTSSKDRTKTIRSLQNYGSLTKYQHEEIGVNSRLDELQAAFLIHKLKFLNWQLEHRRKTAQYFIGELPQEIQLPRGDDNTYKSAWHLFVIRHSQRDRLISHLKSRGVQCLVHYPKSIDQHKAFRELNLSPCPVSNQLANEVLSLPIGPHITEAEVEYIVRQARDFFGK
ncbi:Aminotransferase [Chitinispirillum alkaliphilum]|nr:Aminotransferase [Chitinispirillum alkaliphilum]